MFWAIREALGHRRLAMVLIEGGGITISRFLGAGSLDRLQITIALIIIYRCSQPRVQLLFDRDLARLGILGE